MQDVSEKSPSEVVVAEEEHVAKHESIMLYEVSCVLSRTLSSGQIMKMQEDLRAAIKRAESAYGKWFKSENERLLRAMQPKRATL